MDTVQREEGIMAISVKFFANLRDVVGITDDTVDAKEVTSALDVWHKLSKGAAIPANVIVAINLENVEVDHPVKDGDKVAFFPPVTGG
jgi:molybdopterin synthase sulfur carrier subunit